MSQITWIDVPSGKVTLREYVEIRGDKSSSAALESYGTFDLPAFQIGKYPITNTQFAPFIETGGDEPHFWQDARWNGADYPVVGVSWSEALAFCEWLSITTGDQIVLPTEPQWHRAAQGDDGRDCPWGAWDDDDEARCNASIVQPWGNHRTSPVYQYEGKGDSPFNVVDMLGNVEEWTLTEYQPEHHDESGIGWRVTCGSWNPYWYGHLNSRTGSREDFRHSNTGFRVCRYNRISLSMN